jgi:hypothetical protein
MTVQKTGPLVLLMVTVLCALPAAAVVVGVIPSAFAQEEEEDDDTNTQVAVPLTDQDQGAANLGANLAANVDTEEIIEEARSATPTEEASELTCPVPGFTLSKGECTAEPTITATCDPSSVADIPVQRSDSTCVVVGPLFVISEEVCDGIEGSTFNIRVLPPPPPMPPFPPPPPPPPLGVCTFPATETISCPGDVTPTEEGECITKPG